jgi:hypothetical protein
MTPVDNIAHFLLAPPLRDGSVSFLCRQADTTGAVLELNFHLFVAVPYVMVKTRSPEIQLTSQSPDFVALVGSLSCVPEYRGFRASGKQLSREPNFPVTNNCSDRFFRKSQECFGRRKRRRTLRHAPIVRCVRPSFISPASVNGRARRSLPSLRKSSNATGCATSRWRRAARSAAGW